MTHPHRSLNQLLQQGQVWRGSQTAPSPATTILSSGHPELDDALPGGWQPGNLVELHYRREGCGELRLLLPLLARLSQQDRWIIWIDPPHTPFAPALAEAGIDISRILVVHSKNHQQHCWAMEQALQSGGCSAVLGWPKQVDSRAIRRLQVAASQQPALGFLFRRDRAREQGSAAAYRLQLQPLAHNTGVTLLKRRHGWPLPQRPMDLGQHRLLPSNRSALARLK